MHNQDLHSWFKTSCKFKEIKRCLTRSLVILIETIINKIIIHALTIWFFLSWVVNIFNLFKVIFLLVYLYVPILNAFSSNKFPLNEAYLLFLLIIIFFQKQMCKVSANFEGKRIYGSFTQSMIGVLIASNEDCIPISLMPWISEYPKRCESFKYYIQHPPVLSHIFSTIQCEFQFKRIMKNIRIQNFVYSNTILNYCTWHASISFAQVKGNSFCLLLHVNIS